MNELALFAGAGGGLLASKLLGWNTIGAVEIEKYPREVLLQRQRDGMLDQFPIWDDVRTFDGKPWRGLVDVVSGGFPCQDISVAGTGVGLAGARSGLWFEYLRIVDEIRPRYVFAENSPNLRGNGLGTVIKGLTDLGYGVRWGVLGAWHLGANHKRNRMWVLAYSNEIGRNGRASCDSATRSKPGKTIGFKNSRSVMADPIGRRYGHPQTEICTGRYAAIDGGMDGADTNNSSQCTDSGCGCGRQSSPSRDNACGVCSSVPNADSTGCEEQRGTIANGSKHPAIECGGWWESEPRVGRVANGVAHRVDRLKAIGNGQVPPVAVAAFKILSS